MNVAIYCRVSTGDQDPGKQERILRDYAVANNLGVFKVYTDVVSGKKQSRPMLDVMLRDMREKRFKAILVWKVDRLGRSLKHLFNISQECYNKHIGLIFMSQNIDTTTAQGKLFFHILGAIAEFESDLISERTKLGQKGAKNIGKRGKDKKQRSKSGYYIRHARDRKKMGVGIND